MLEDLGLQINVKFIDTIERLRAKGRPLEDFDPEILISATPFNRNDLWAELLELVQNINPPLKELVLGILPKYETQFMDWPGAVFYHHAYTGGLLEHTPLTVARHAQRCLEIYPAPQPQSRVVLAARRSCTILANSERYRRAQPVPQRTVAGQAALAISSWAGRWHREEARIRAIF